jgi:hypothetical protein
LKPLEPTDEDDDLDMVLKLAAGGSCMDPIKEKI